MLFDTHAHMDDRAFREDRDTLLERFPSLGVGLLMNPGCDRASSYNAIALAEQYDYVYAAVGSHPDACDKVDDALIEEYRKLCKLHPKVKAIGEIGLDYHYEDHPREIQQKAFRMQMQLAKELDLPVIVHERDAHQDGLGFTGVLTFKNARRAVEVAANIPLNRLVLETDCPYMAPEPFRGKRNDPGKLCRTAQKLAQIRGVSVEEICRVTTQNGKRLYRIN